MRTVVLGERPAEIEAFLARRRALGHDRYDEVWAGSYHVAPYAHAHHGMVQIQLARVLGPWGDRAGLIGTNGFTLGWGFQDFRVPDGGFFVEAPNELYVPTAVIVIEVLSLDDETYEKLDFYAAHGVQEILIAHPQERWVRCLDLQNGLVEMPRSRCLDVAMADVIAEIAWP
jgi:Uma2 family endonuclease